VPKGEHHANGPAEKGIGDIDRMTKAIMTDKNIPSRFWDIVAEHCVVLNAVTSPAVDEPTKTIFEATYGQPPDYDALPPVGCYAVRLLEKQHRKDFRFDLTNQPGIFLGYATYNNIYGAVLFAEKALVVGRLQIAFDPNFFPLTDKSSDNPRFKFLHALLGRGSDALDAATDNDDVEVDLQDSSSAPNPPSDADDAVSSDDDDASKALLSELLQSSPVPALTRCVLSRCQSTRYRIQQLPQPPLVASRLLLLQHLRLCLIALLLTRCRMRLSVVVFDRARSLHASTLARCSNLRLVVSRWRLLVLLSPPRSATL
jgi:hypothetical protein